MLLPAFTPAWRGTPRSDRNWIVAFVSILIAGAIGATFLRQALGSPGRPAAAVAVLAVAAIASVTIHPPTRGLVLTVTSAAAVGMAATVATASSRALRPVVLPLVGGAALEGFVMAAQWFTGRSVALGLVHPTAHLAFIDGFLHPRVSPTTPTRRRSFVSSPRERS